MAVAVGNSSSCSRRAQPWPPGRPGRVGPSRRSAGAARAPTRPCAAPGSRRSARCRRRRTQPHAPKRAGRSSSLSGRSRGCRHRCRSSCRRGSAGSCTPRSNPSRLTRMKSAAGPWNQVAIMNPSSCQTVANRSQSPASRHTAQFSTRSRICWSSLTVHTAEIGDAARGRDWRPGGLAADVGGSVGVEASPPS